MFNNANQHINVYGDDIEVDYRGYEVNRHDFNFLLNSSLQINETLNLTKERRLKNLRLNFFRLLPLL